MMMMSMASQQHVCMCLFLKKKVLWWLEHARNIQCTAQHSNQIENFANYRKFFHLEIVESRNFFLLRHFSQIYQKTEVYTHTRCCRIRFYFAREKK